MSSRIAGSCRRLSLATMLVLGCAIPSSASSVTLDWFLSGAVYLPTGLGAVGFGDSGGGPLPSNQFSDNQSLTLSSGTAAGFIGVDAGSLHMAVSASSDVSRFVQSYVYEQADYRESGVVTGGGQFQVTFSLSATDGLTGARASCTTNFPVNSFQTDAFFRAAPEVLGNSAAADFDTGYTNVCGNPVDITESQIVTFSVGQAVTYRNYLLLGADATLGAAFLDASDTQHLYIDPITPGASIAWASGASHVTPQASDVVPEPSTLLLVGGSLAALLGRTSPKSRRWVRWSSQDLVDK